MPRRNPTRLASALPMVILLTLGLAGSASAQQGGMERLVTADGVRLDYPPDGVWRLRARRVAEWRALLRSQRQMGALNAPAQHGAPQSAEAAVAGSLGYPTILYGFADTDTASLPPPARYDSVFYTPTPLAGRPYSVHTLYDEMSNGLLQVGGHTYGWIQGPNMRTYYLDACGAAVNILDCVTGRARIYQLFVGALDVIDAQVDFGQFDNDGPDGIPNSGDDDGVVDVVQFVGPVVGGECGGRGIWAHKFALKFLAGGSSYPTKDPSARGGTIKLDPYHAVSGVGGEPCRDTTQIMGIGTASHELGHGLGLPDLYDVGGATQGAGEWSLMGSANYTTLLSPGHFDAWSKSQLGWVVLRVLTAPGSYTLGPVVSGDTVLEIRPRGPNPRGEYFLLENKQALGSDSANMTIGGRAGPKVGGLLVWHVDSLKASTTGLGSGNSVNAGAPHGLALVQADGRGDLDRNDAQANRGDDGDPYPGRTLNTALGKTTNPAAPLNNDGSFAGLALQNIKQDVPNGPMSFQLRFATIVRASDTLAQVAVGGVLYHRFQDVLSPDSALRISVDSAQTTPDGRARYIFSSWSDGGARTHDVVAAGAPDSIIAALAASYQLQVISTGAGSIAATPAADLAGGTFFSAGSVVRLVARSGPDSVFDGWTGDTTTARDTLVLIMNRPYTLAARFVLVLAAPPQTAPAGIMGAGYQYDLVVSGGGGRYTWSVASGQLPPGLTLFTSGRVSGTPEAIGTFDAMLRVVSGYQSLNVALRFVVAAPVVATEAAVDQLLGVRTSLTDDQVRYFDLLGNRNSRYDLGDFLAWVQKTGVRPSAQVMARVLAAAKERKP